MKVVHLVKTSYGAIWAFRQMRELVKMGIEVHVIMPLDGSLVPQYKESGIIIHEFNYNYYNIIFTIIRLRQTIKKIQPDIVHSHFLLCTIFMRLALIKEKYVKIFQIPGPLHLEHKIFKYIDIFTANENDYWIGSCRKTNEILRLSGIKDTKIYLSYYGTDIPNITLKKGKLREQLKIGESIIIIGMVAYIYPPKRYLFQKRGIKGHEDFIDAISILIKTYPNLRGICIGGVWNNNTKYEKRLIEYSYNKCGNNIIFLGTRNDVLSLYPDIDIVVHPSHSENLGGAGESLLLGIPTITTNVGGFPDIIENEKTGLMVSKKSPEQISKAIEYLLKNKEKKNEMCKNGKELVKDILDVKNSSKVIINIYNSILKH